MPPQHQQQQWQQTKALWNPPQAVLAPYAENATDGDKLKLLHELLTIEPREGHFSERCLEGAFSACAMKTN